MGLYLLLATVGMNLATGPVSAKRRKPVKGLDLLLATVGAGLDLSTLAILLRCRLAMALDPAMGAVSLNWRKAAMPGEVRDAGESGA